MKIFENFRARSPSSHAAHDGTRDPRPRLRLGETHRRPGSRSQVLPVLCLLHGGFSHGREYIVKKTESVVVKSLLKRKTCKGASLYHYANCARLRVYQYSRVLMLLTRLVNLRRIELDASVARCLFGRYQKRSRS